MKEAESFGESTWEKRSKLARVSVDNRLLMFAEEPSDGYCSLAVDPLAPLGSAT